MATSELEIYQPGFLFKEKKKMMMMKIYFVNHHQTWNVKINITIQQMAGYQKGKTPVVQCFPAWRINESVTVLRLTVCDIVFSSSITTISTPIIVTARRGRCCCCHCCSVYSIISHAGVHSRCCSGRSVKQLQDTHTHTHTHRERERKHQSPESDVDDWQRNRRHREQPPAALPTTKLALIQN